jgi:hypothetical protein
MTAVLLQHLQNQWNLQWQSYEQLRQRQVIDALSRDYDWLEQRQQRYERSLEQLAVRVPDGYVHSQPVAMGAVESVYTLAKDTAYDLASKGLKNLVVYGLSYAAKKNVFVAGASNALLGLWNWFAEKGVSEHVLQRELAPQEAESATLVSIPGAGHVRGKKFKTYSGAIVAQTDEPLFDRNGNFGRVAKHISSAGDVTLGVV